MKFRIDLKILFFLALFFLTRQLKVYLIVMLFALLHEIAHLLVGIILRFRPKQIEMMPFGFWIDLEPKEEDYKRKIIKSNITELKYIFVALAGPLFNLIMVILFEKLNIEKTIKDLIIYSNFFLFILNLIPIYPLDGGRILRSILRIFQGKKLADKNMKIIANTAIALLTFAGSIAILYLKNIAIFFILIYLWILVLKEKY